MSRFEEAQKHRAAIRKSRELENAIDLSRVITARFFQGALQARSAARMVASQTVSDKPDKTGTTYVPDLVAIEKCANALVLEAEKIIKTFRDRPGKTPNVHLPITQATAVALYVCVLCEQLVKDGRRKRVIKFVDDNPQFSDRICHYIADLVDGCEIESLLTAEVDNEFESRA